MDSSNNYWENFKSESISTQQIIQLACCEENQETYWDYVLILRMRGSNEELVEASKLCQSQSPKKRSLGVDILGELGIPQRTFLTQCGDILLNLLSNESDSNVLASIGFAFGHLNDARSVEPLVKLKNHPNVDVRMGVVSGLMSQSDELAIQALIDLSSDENEDIRNWATFSLGSQIETDTPAIRDALLTRIILETSEDETIAEIRGEALLGLALRKDERVISPLIAELESDCVGRLAVEAAKEIGDAKLYPALIKLQQWWDLDIKLLEEAISNCNSNSSI
ncbi:hypothetical protein NIES21_59520 (plasmid) [Anabaenopsis circularis NIES-21]|uniref:Uncharacterized protein n=1 Tax=Anabaenopsis circularis NIES-21 TaxID=1085406 RepID=A0A1Z4GRE2_9CYAN|nr:hypothetical protein NIES21_59520 [Anabaenopsis circularis NIES-21]